MYEGYKKLNVAVSNSYFRIRNCVDGHVHMKLLRYAANIARSQPLTIIIYDIVAASR